MKVKFNYKARSSQPEIMDDFMLSGKELDLLLKDLKTVNVYLGGRAITINGLEKLLAENNKKTEITIIDIGCGDGEMLRLCSEYGKRKGLVFKLIGVDANKNIIDIAKEKSSAYTNIEYHCCEISSKQFENLEFDIALCTLFLHHMPESQLPILLEKIYNRSKVGIIINDLHRSWFAFQLFKVFSLLFIKTKIAKHDGLVSVARAFKRKDLEVQQAHLKGVTSTIQWKWAFRWQWILQKTN